MIVSRNVPPMDSPSIMFAQILDEIVVAEADEGTLLLVCRSCLDHLCEIEHDDTVRVLLNTALAHVCGE